MADTLPAESSAIMPSHQAQDTDQDWDSLLQTNDQESRDDSFVGNRRPEDIAAMALDQPADTVASDADILPSKRETEGPEHSDDLTTSFADKTEDVGFFDNLSKDGIDDPIMTITNPSIDEIKDEQLPLELDKQPSLEPLQTDFQEVIDPTSSEDQVRPFSIIASSATDFFAQHTDDADDMDDWARELASDGPLSQGNEQSKGISDAFDNGWTKSLAGQDQNVDANWESAFADDEGFLEDDEDFNARFEQAMNLSDSPALSDTTGNVAQKHAANPALNSLPIPTQAQSKTTSPMVFFEELPSTKPARTRRGKPASEQSNNFTLPGPPHVGAQPLQTPPLTTLGSQQYQQFRPPEKLDPFPPSLTQSTHVSSSSPVQGLLASQHASSRYSPATQPATTTARYATMPSPALVPHSLSSQVEHPTDPTQSPRSFSPYAPSPPSQPSKASKYAKAPSPTPPPSTAVASVPLAAPTAPPPRPIGPSDARTNVAATSESRYSPSSRAAEIHNSPPKIPHQQSVYAPDLSGTSEPLSYHVPPPANKFAPRTSSPLAQFEHNTETQIRRSISNSYSPAVSPPTTQMPSLSSPLATERASAYAPDSHSGDQRRSLSTSPQLYRSETSNKHTSYPSAHGILPTPQHFFNQIAVQTPHQSDTENLLPPNDETIADPLTRWKGRPIFRWSPSGLLSCSFPKHIPQYGGGQTAPMVKSLAGDVKTRKAKEILAEESFTSFPGPLKNKNKKKDVVSWMSSKISSFDTELKDENLPSAQRLRIRETSILWQIVKLLVEHDGVLGGKASVDEAIRKILSVEESEPQLASTDSDAVPDANVTSKHELIRELRESLAVGDRAKAVWHAVDNKNWGHAMLIASTLNTSIWKQVAQEFVRVEVRGSSQERKSLAALYQTFGGNWEESVDELVPVSARAGFQMISTVAQPGESRDALEGLNEWRDTLSLILSNRSKDDEKTLLALGKLLAGYGRTEAAHVCYILAHPVSSFAGIDGQETHFTLIGSRFVDGSVETSNNGDSIILSEIYEFAICQAAGQTSQQSFPHLLAYKLQHAYLLAESGHRMEALQYCETVASLLKSSTRPSQYYHATLFSQLDDLEKRLSQSPKDPASSWIAKPSFEKVSSGMWARFNSFVAGEEGDATSNASGYQSESESGPFAKANGDSPTISRSGSIADLYGMGAITGTGAGPVSTTSRYAPSPYLAGQDFNNYGRPTSSGSTNTSFGSPPVLSHFPRQPSQLSRYQTVSNGESHSKDRPTKRAVSYEPYVPSVSEEPSPAGSPAFGPMDFDSNSVSGVGQRKPSGLNITDSNDSSFGPDDSTMIVSESTITNGYGSSLYEPPTSSYEPPTSSYQPYDAEETAEEVSPKQKKKSIMDDEDDDEDFARREAESKRAAKAKRDREADDAVRKAAEADAARDKAAAGEKKGWLGGWFGKKDPNAPVVHKAKLGEENSFYYDAETKKWVNKKAGADTAVAAAAPTPPPPKGPPMRSTSGPPTSIPRSASTGPPPPSVSTAHSGSPASPAFFTSDHILQGSGPPSRSGTPMSESSGLGGDRPPPPPLTKPLLPPGAGPPSRPSTSMSNASSIDDLIGGPTARKAGAGPKKGKKGQRYVDVMAQS